MDAVGVSDPARCVYVGDRLFDDVYGAHHAGMRAIHVPHSRIPTEQVGHTEAGADAVSTASRTSRRSCAAGREQALTSARRSARLHVCAMRKREERERSRPRPGLLHAFARRYSRQSPTSRRGPLIGLWASAVRVLVSSGECLGSSRKASSRTVSRSAAIAHRRVSPVELATR